MGKQSGLGDNFYVGAYNLSGDISALSRIAGGPAALEMTGIDKSAIERKGGVRTGGMSFTSFFNDATGQAHPTLSALPRTDVIASYFRGTTLGGQAASVVGKQINYDPQRATDGALTLGVDVESNAYGLEWGRMLTAGQRTDTSATNGTSVDFGAAGSNGLQAYLHVFAFTGTSVTVKLQSSSDNGAGDAFADVVGGGFTVVSGLTSERIALTGAVERYLRVVTTGTFSEAVFAVNVVVNETAVAF